MHAGLENYYVVGGNGSEDAPSIREKVIWTFEVN